MRPFYPDPADPGGKFGMVDVAPVMPVKKPVALAEMKGVPELAGMALLRQSRLSVCPVSDTEWRVICRDGGDRRHDRRDRRCDILPGRGKPAASWFSRSPYEIRA